MGLEGDLRTMPLSDVLRALLEQEEKGRLFGSIWPRRDCSRKRTCGAPSG